MGNHITRPICKTPSLPKFQIMSTSALCPLAMYPVVAAAAAAVSARKAKVICGDSKIFPPVPLIPWPRKWPCMQQPLRRRCRVAGKKMSDISDKSRPLPSHVHQYRTKGDGKCTVKWLWLAACRGRTVSDE